MWQKMALKIKKKKKKKIERVRAVERIRHFSSIPVRTLVMCSTKQEQVSVGKLWINSNYHH